VSTSTVPVTRDGLGVECHHHTGDLSDPLLEKGYRLAHKCCKSRLKRVQKLHPYLKNVAGNPHLVTSRNADRGTDLELPLKPVSVFAMVRKMIDTSGYNTHVGQCSSISPVLA
jgi:hypothetical protein